MEYFVWESKVDPGVCVLNVIENVPDSFELSKGVSREQGFPGDALFRMNKAHPKDDRLADQLANIGSLTLVSANVAEYLRTLNLENVEFLPVAILDHKDRVASDSYFVVNPMSVVDCIDQAASDLLWGSIDKDSISGVYALELLDDFGPTPDVFRPKHLTDVVLVSEQFVEAVQAQGFTGVDFVSLDEFEQ